VPLIVVGVMNVIFGLAVLIRERGSAVGLGYSLLNFGASLWLLSFAGVYSTSDASVALTWVRIEHMGLVILPAGQYVFAASVTRTLRWRSPWPWAALVCAALFAPVILTDWLVTGLHRYAWGYYPALGWPGALLLAYFAVFTTASMHLYRTTARNTQSAVQRRRVERIMIALLIANFALIDFLPAFGVPVYPFGYVFISAFILLAGRAVWKDRLVDITPALAARQIVDTMADGLLVFDRDGVIRVANGAAGDLLGAPYRSLIGRPWADAHERWPDDPFDPLGDPAEMCSLEVDYRRADGMQGTATVSTSKLYDHRGEWVGTVRIMRDITERKRDEEQIRYLAFHDPLTGAATRSVLMGRLGKALAQAHRSGDGVGLVFIDLDGFKDINDTQGHEAGDRVLCYIADTLAALVREGDTVARVGGDEFVLLLPTMSGVDEATLVAGRVLRQLAEDAAAPEGPRIAASLGIAAYPGDGADSETLLRNADAAMYEAKRSGGGYRLYASSGADAGDGAQRLVG
jgi:diguanylate cyclase (GGDEF)-like protein/PAS domain S-box-containing protein